MQALNYLLLILIINDRRHHYNLTNTNAPAAFRNKVMANLCASPQVMNSPVFPSLDVIYCSETERERQRVRETVTEKHRERKRDSLSDREMGH